MYGTPADTKVGVGVFFDFDKDGNDIDFKKKNKTSLQNKETVDQIILGRPGF